MKVTRITLDSELGLIELKTGPGGDGNYVLLPLDIPPTAERFLRLPGEVCIDALPEEGEVLMTNESVVPSGGSLIASGGWYAPKDQAYDFNFTPGIGKKRKKGKKAKKAKDSGVVLDFLKNPGEYLGPLEYRRALEKEHLAYLAAEADDSPAGPPLHKDDNGVFVSDECDGNCGAHPVDPVVQAAYLKADAVRADDIARQQADWAGNAKIDPEDYYALRHNGVESGFWHKEEASRERHTGPATCPDPVPVFATDYGHGYRLTCPALPSWIRTINKYDLHRVPGLVSAAMGESKRVSITIIEED